MQKFYAPLIISLLTFTFLFNPANPIFSMQKKTRYSYKDISIKDIEYVINNAGKNILKTRVNKNHWNYPSYLGTHFISLYYVLLKWFDKSDTNLDEKRLKSILLKDQLKDGSWYAIKDANLNYGDINATIYNYFALKVMGMDVNDDRMKRAKNFIISKGGIEKSALFTRIWMSLFQNYPWSKIPKIPLMLFKKKGIVTYHSFSQWVMPHLLPIAYLRYHKISKNFNASFQLDELWKSKKPEVSYIPDEPVHDDVKKMIDILFSTQQPKGSWGGYTISSLLTIMVLNDVKKWFPQYSKNADISIEKAFKFIEAMYFKSGTGAYKGVLDDGKYWDTSLLATALLEAGYNPKKLYSTARFLLKQQTKNGGFAFGWDFWYAPDIDDTAEIIMTLHHLKAPKKNINKAVKWIISMQNDDGGWGAFDKNNTGNFVLRYFAKDFKDSADLFDESSPDIAGHVLEAFSLIGLNKTNSESVRKAIKYLKKTQNKTIWAWEARWGINYIYGSSAALVGLIKAGEDPSQEYIQKGLKWLLSAPNRDGGWGESTLSYNDIKHAGKGISTASQTAWALLPLIEAGLGNTDEVKNGIKYLIKEFKKYGKWKDHSTVGTGHPRIIYMNYPSYPYAFPLMAMSKYYKFIKKNNLKKR